MVYRVMLVYYKHGEYAIETINTDAELRSFLIDYIQDSDNDIHTFSLQDLIKHTYGLPKQDDYRIVAIIKGVIGHIKNICILAIL